MPEDDILARLEAEKAAADAAAAAASAGAEGGEGGEKKPPAEPPAKPQALSREELDEMLRERDTSLLNTIRETVGGMLTQFAPREPAREREAEPKAPEMPTREEYYNDPAGAMEKFFNAKTATLRKEPERREPDPTAVAALIEARRLEIKSRVGDEYKKYENWFNEIIKRTDPRVLVDPVAMDATWRLAKSYADEASAADAAKREERNKRAGLESSGAKPEPPRPKVELNADQSYVAEGMGLAPEDFVKYSKAEEVEIGANRKKK